MSVTSPRALGLASPLQPSTHPTLAKHIPNLRVPFLPFAILQGKRRAPQSPQLSHQSDNNRSNLLSLGTATNVTWELFPCRCDPPGYKHCQDADHQYTIVGHIKNGGSLIKELIDTVSQMETQRNKKFYRCQHKFQTMHDFYPKAYKKTGRTETGHEKLKLLKYLLLQPARIAPGFFTRLIAKKELVSLSQRQ